MHTPTWGRPIKKLKRTTFPKSGLSTIDQSDLYLLTIAHCSSAESVIEYGIVSKWILKFNNNSLVRAQQSNFSHGIPIYDENISIMKTDQEIV